MSIASPIFSHRVAFDPGAPIDELLRAIPAKWAVYLLADADDRPVQLLCVKNLRYSLKRRIGGEEPSAPGPSRRVDYRDLVRFIHYRRVDSAFEADCVYLEAAREIFPQSYRGMVGFRPAWFLHVNPQTQFPRYTKTIDLSTSTGLLLGPIEDKHAANRAMELAQSAFDLCRYYNILIEAPHGKACAYKEMGRCPAPCDGTISMQEYHAMIFASAEAMIDPAAAQAEFKQRMEAAAANLQFEQAGRIKARTEELGQFGKGPFRFIRRLENFRYLSLQRGPRAGCAKIFLITPGEVCEWAGLIDEPKNAGELLRALLADAKSVHHSFRSPLSFPFPGTPGEGRVGTELEGARDSMIRDKYPPSRLSPGVPGEGEKRIAAERIGVVSHHLFSPKNTGGVFLPLDMVEEKSFLKAYRDLQKQKVADEIEAEGVVKELTAIESDNVGGGE